LVTRADGVRPCLSHAPVSTLGPAGPEPDPVGVNSGQHLEDLMRSLSVEGTVERPGFAWVGVALQLFVGVMAVPVGIAMILEPNGSPIGIPHDWIAGSPFGSFLVPGVFLLTVNGAGQLAGAALVLLRHWLAPWWMGALGVGLLIWIGVQVVMIPFSFLQPVIFAIGLVQGFVALFWLRRIGIRGAI
jgi:hypothetical protein